ncbi:MAG: hypothetical protein CVU89_05175 [Firmicutes bacterium HGW-Firmicutes-14]|nr:MAG: hypothetical protein CVU89_05175 [Firmicutes bacterium HGW-Firmicutes-14]
MVLETKTLLDLSEYEDIYPADMLFVGEYIYILDKFGHSIKVFDTSGELVKTIGSKGSGEKEFFYPAGMDMDRDGRIFVADSYNHRIQVLSKEGEFLYSFGSYGSGEDEFAEPTDVAVDRDGNLWVVDCGNHRVKRTNPDGKCLATVGEQGSELGNFKYPLSITIDDENYIYVVDNGNGRIQKFNGKADYILMIGQKGENPHQFVKPISLATKRDFVYVFDDVSHKIVKYSKHGYFIEAFEKIDEYLLLALHIDKLFAVSGRRIIELGDTDARTERGIIEANNVGHVHESLGYEILAKYTFKENEFETFNCVIEKVSGLAIKEHHENIQIIDYLFDNKFYDKGFNIMKHQFRSLPLQLCEKQYYNYLDNKVKNTDNDILKEKIIDFIKVNYVYEDYEIGGYGTELGQFNQPYKVDFDSKGNFFVTDSFNHRVQKFSYSGEPLMQIGDYGTKEGQFNGPIGILIDREDKVFVCDYGNHRIQVFSTNGEYIDSFGENLEGPVWITADENQILVGDNIKNNIHIYSKQGEFLDNFNIPDINFSRVPYEILIDRANHRTWYLSYDENKIVIEDTGNTMDVVNKCKENVSFNNPYSVALDKQGYIYISETGGFHKFDKNFNLIYSYRMSAKNAKPVNIKIFKNKVVIVDNPNNMIHCFTQGYLEV